jgi:hypothetical protein
LATPLEHSDNPLPPREGRGLFGDAGMTAEVDMGGSALIEAERGVERARASLGWAGARSPSRAPEEADRGRYRQ